MKIRVHIDRVVLDGIDLSTTQRPAFQESLQTELSRLLTERGVHDSLRSGGAVPHLQAPAIAVHASPQGRALGTAVARSVEGGLRK